MKPNNAIYVELCYLSHAALSACKVLTKQLFSIQPNIMLLQ